MLGVRRDEVALEKHNESVMVQRQRIMIYYLIINLCICI